MISVLNNTATAETGDRQLYALGNLLDKNTLTLDSFGDSFPGILLTVNLDSLNVSYMNKLGCDNLKHSADELMDKGSLYFQMFFFPDEVAYIMSGYTDLHKLQDPHTTFSFLHKVLIPGEKFPHWYFASAKLHFERNDTRSNTIILIANKLETVDRVTQKIASVLEESELLKKHFQKFSKLSKREKEIITLLVNGKNTAQISDLLYISRHTVNTHRKNIASKLEIKSNAELYRFAATFNLLD